MQRRTLLKALPALAGAAASVAAPARAAAFPEHPIRILLGFPAGGTTDAILRRIAEEASRVLRQPVLVDNRPGGGSTISLLGTKNAAPDGYTLAVSTTAAFSTPIQFESAYDPIQDSTYIIRLTNVTFGLSVLASSPIKTLHDLLAYARARPGKVSYGVPGGLGNTGHLAVTEIAARERLDLTVVPYKGSADLQQSLLGGFVDFAADGSGGFLPMVNAGKERLLAVLTEKRVPLWPQIPCLKELGYPISFDSPWGLVGPPKMDAKIVGTLHDAFKKALEAPSVAAAIVAAGQSNYYLGPADYTRYAAQESEHQRQLLTKYGFARKL